VRPAKQRPDGRWPSHDEVLAGSDHWDPWDLHLATAHKNDKAVLRALVGEGNKRLGKRSGAGEILAFLLLVLGGTGAQARTGAAATSTGWPSGHGWSPTAACQ
jgi:hypothetical protein